MFKDDHNPYLVVPKPLRFWAEVLRELKASLVSIWSGSTPVPTEFRLELQESPRYKLLVRILASILWFFTLGPILAILQLPFRLVSPRNAAEQKRIIDQILLTISDFQTFNGKFQDSRKACLSRISKD